MLSLSADVGRKKRDRMEHAGNGRNVDVVEFCSGTMLVYIVASVVIGNYQWDHGRMRFDLLSAQFDCFEMSPQFQKREKKISKREFCALFNSGYIMNSEQHSDVK